MDETGSYSHGGRLRRGKGDFELAGSNVSRSNCSFYREIGTHRVRCRDWESIDRRRESLAIYMRS